jgi:hypothetical protein
VRWQVLCCCKSCDVMLVMYGEKALIRVIKCRVLLRLLLGRCWSVLGFRSGSDQSAVVEKDAEQWQYTGRALTNQ